MDLPYVVPRIPYLRLHLTLRAQQAATLPAYKGSMLRGAFGHALRKAVCIMGPEQPCSSCLIRQTCYNTQLFEPVYDKELPAALADLPILPRAYIFEPAFEPGNETRRLKEGDLLEFDLLLFGKAIDLQLYAMLASERMAVTGLGRNRAPFRLERALSFAADGTWKVVLEEGRMRGRGTSRPTFPSQEPLGPRATLRFLTPTRIRVEHHRTETTTFPELITAMARRLFEVAYFHVRDCPVDWNIEPLLAAAREVKVTGLDLRWQDWERYNARQKTSMNMGGFLGTVDLEGDLTPFTALLRTAEILHVGRGTPFGLGKVEISSTEG